MTSHALSQAAKKYFLGQLDRLASSSELMKQGKVLQVISFIVQNLHLGAAISMKTIIRGQTLIGRIR